MLCHCPCVPCLACCLCCNYTNFKANWRPEEDAEVGNAPADTTLGVVQQAIRSFSGKDVTMETDLAHCGLTSFGATALVGLLKPSLPHAAGLSPLKLHQLKTVGAL